MKTHGLRSQIFERRTGYCLLMMLLILAGCTSSAETVSQPTSTIPKGTSPDAPVATPGPTVNTAVPTATQPAPTDAPTFTPSPAPSAAAATPPSPTPPTPIDGTLLLYTTPVTGADGQTYWAFRTLPPLPQLDPAAFDAHYGPDTGTFDSSMFFASYNPQPSPDGQALIVPGLPAYPEYGVEGTPTWLLDLATGATRQLLPHGVIATWSRDSDAVAYVEGDTLYTLDVIPEAAPKPVFQHPDLWDIYAKWSPDGQWIAAVTGTEHEPTGETETNLTLTYWLVPPGGGPARELAQLETYSAGYGASDLAWSPDGQFLRAHGWVYDLAGNLLPTGDAGGLEWLPDRPQLLYWMDGALRVITPTGDEIARVQVNKAAGTSWAFSPDGRRLAFGMPPEEEGIPLAVHDFDSGETRRIGVVPDAVYFYSLHWSADGSLLIFTAGTGEGRDDIWTMPATPGAGAPERMLADATLIEALPWGGGQ